MCGVFKTLFDSENFVTPSKIQAHIAYIWTQKQQAEVPRRIRSWWGKEEPLFKVLRKTNRLPKIALSAAVENLIRKAHHGDPMRRELLRYRMGPLKQAKSMPSRSYKTIIHSKLIARTLRTLI